MYLEEVKGLVPAGGESYAGSRMELETFDSCLGSLGSVNVLHSLHVQERGRETRGQPRHQWTW